jgi:cyclopropane-fatty-acyl-phospholipid synthase
MFPGSHIPVLSNVIQALSMRDLEIRDIENLRQHYILTTRAWRDNYERNVDQIREMFDEVFVRQWRLYWNLAISSFEWGGNRLFQILVSKGANGTNNNTLPLTRAHLYRE